MLPFLVNTAVSAGNRSVAARWRHQRAATGLFLALTAVFKNYVQASNLPKYGGGKFLVSKTGAVKFSRTKIRERLGGTYVLPFL